MCRRHRHPGVRHARRAAIAAGAVFGLRRLHRRAGVGGRKDLLRQVRHVSRRRSRRHRARAGARRQCVRRVLAGPRSAPAARSARDDAANRAGKPVRRGRRAVMAFLLRDADMPAGRTALPTDRAELARITFDRGRTGAVPAAARGRRCRAAGRTVFDHPRRGRRSNGRPTAPISPARATRPLDQITKDNFNRAADRLAAQDRLPGPATRHALLGDAAGGRQRALHDRRHAARRRRAQRRHRRDALDARRGRRPRGHNATRSGAGRGVAYWSSADGADRRIIYVTPGYRMIALDAKTGAPIPAFGQQRRRRSEARGRPGSRSRHRARSG